MDYTGNGEVDYGDLGEVVVNYDADSASALLSDFVEALAAKKISSFLN